ncbi:MAG: alpha/beta fold hydrolase [Ilumatobacteraceae bacterium]
MTLVHRNQRMLRTPDANFSALVDFPFEPHYFDLDGLRMHYVDEGPDDGPVALLMHGMPTWSYLYRYMIPPLVAAGYRCVAPDHIGFGRSDKVVDPDWYNIARHSDNVQRLVSALDLKKITLFVQDWGGPTGLAQYANMPERFERLVIMNTWLHHEGFEYSPGILQWIQQNLPGGLFRDNVPTKFLWGTLMAMSTGRVSPQNSLFKILGGETPDLSTDANEVRRAYDAPFEGLGEPGVTGPRRFPMSIPVHDPVAGNAEVQSRHFEMVNATTLPVHFVWGVNDNVFTRDWGRKWHGLIQHSTWHEVEAGHFLQDTNGAEIVAHVLEHVG